MNNSTDTHIAISLDRQAELVRRVQAANQPLPGGFNQGLAGRTTLALATTIVLVGAVLVFAIR